MKPTDGTPAGGGPAGHQPAPDDFTHGQMENPDTVHEHSDVNVRAILIFASIVAAVCVAAAIIVLGVFTLFEKQAKARDPQLSPLAVSAPDMPRTTAGSPYFGAAPSPELITSEPTVLRQLRDKEDKALNQYGWVDQGAGIAHVPIEQAKKLLIERGLPSRAGGVPADLGTDAPALGEASGGRTIPTEEPGAAAAPQEPAQAAPPEPAQAAPQNEKPAPAPTGRGGGA
jgi:hypothetical protein